MIMFAEADVMFQRFKELNEMPMRQWLKEVILNLYGFENIVTFVIFLVVKKEINNEVTVNNFDYFSQ